MVAKRGVRLPPTGQNIVNASKGRDRPENGKHHVGPGGHRERLPDADHSRHHETEDNKPEYGISRC